MQPCKQVTYVFWNYVLITSLVTISQFDDTHPNSQKIMMKSIFFLNCKQNKNITSNSMIQGIALTFFF